jgi:hypothetical protein
MIKYDSYSVALIVDRFWRKVPTRIVPEPKGKEPTGRSPHIKLVGMTRFELATPYFRGTSARFALCVGNCLLIERHI